MTEFCCALASSAQYPVKVLERFAKKWDAAHCCTPISAVQALLRARTLLSMGYRVDLDDIGS